MEPPSPKDSHPRSVQDCPPTSTTTDEQHSQTQGQFAQNSPERASQEVLIKAVGQETPPVMPHERPKSSRTSDRRLYEAEKTSLAGSKRHSALYQDDIPLEVGRQQAMRGLKKDLGALVRSVARYFYAVLGQLTQNLQVNFLTCIPFVSLGIALYTIGAIFLLSVLSPLNLCLHNRDSFKTQIRLCLLPATNFHYRCAWSESRATRSNVRRSWPGTIVASASSISDSEMQQAMRTMDPPRNIVLIAVHLLSPLISIPMFFSAFVVALWWIMSAITADDTADGFTQDHPRREGQGGFDEGQNLARGLRLWWIGWLSGQVMRW